MEKAKAIIYFPDTSEDSIEEQYEQKLFEWKQFYVNRFPVSKLYASKSVQLSKIEEAYEFLTGTSHAVQAIEFDSNFPDNLKEAFLHYEKERSRFRQLLFQCDSLAQMIVITGFFASLTAKYASVWKHDFENLDGIVVSKELDPMDLLNALNEAESLGVKTIDDISALSEDHLVVRESKRLSLWLKMDLNG